MLDYTGYTVTTEPATEPVSFSDFEGYARDIPSADETLAGDMLVAARQQIEAMTGRALINRTLEVYWDRWPGKDPGWVRALYLPQSPAASVTSIQYYSTSNVLTTWDSDSYHADINSEPARITLAYGESFPTIRDRANAIVVTYVAGYGAAATAVPKALRMAVMAAALDLYERRDLSIPEVVRANPAIQNLIETYKIHTVV